MRADDALSNPPCNAGNWRGELRKDDKRRACDAPGRDPLRAWRATRDDGGVLHG